MANATNWAPQLNRTNLARECDYAVLLDNRLGQRKFDGGYVHSGLLKAAEYVFDAELEGLRELVERNPTNTLTFTGHSLGAGVAALLTMVALQNRDKLGTAVDRKRIRCYAIAPARCVPLNLAVRYADVINSVVLQDDFLPRTTTALEDGGKTHLPCLLCVMCLKDTCTLEEKMLKDPRRLIGRFPPVVKTARCQWTGGSSTSFFLATQLPTIWIERESQRALDLLLERDRIMEIPAKQKMKCQESLVREHGEEYKATLQRAIALDIPHAALTLSPYGTFNDSEGEHSGRSGEEISLMSFKKWKESWDKFTERLFDVDESGRVVFKRT